MSTSFADSAGERAGNPAPPAAKPLAVTFQTLVRREFWEHRALWIAPAVVSALMILGALFASVKYRLTARGGMPDEGADGMTMFAVMQGSVSMPIVLVMSIVLVFYLLDCLYAERRDRSILFWKSLPVSDGLTVLSKLAVATIIVPLGVFVLGLALSLVFTGIWQVSAALGRLPAIPGWDMGGWLKAELALLACFAVGTLWYAPLAAYLLVVSAWARRSPFLWLLLPPVAAQIVEKVAFDTHYVGSFLGYRLIGIWPVLFAHGHSGHGRSFALSSALNQLKLGAALSNIDLWLGLLAAAGLVFAAIRIRRYRDDS
jgi:ABC-2 type transport system permease protein